jgi:transposase
MKPFKSSNRNQPFLLPPSIQDWLPKEHLARFIVEIVEQLDLSKIESQYSGKGKDAYHPQVMLSLLFYGYATGVFSSRKIERATYDSVAFRYISANTHPDHDTIANFRKRFLVELTDLFVQILSVAQEMGVLKVGKVSLDGTKMKANASKHKALSYGHAIKLQKQLEDEVQTLLKKAESADNKEDCDGMNIPDEIARREDRLEVIKAAKARIEQRANERHKQELQEYEAKIKKRETKEKTTGKKVGGKKPQPPKSKEPNSKDQVNLTDEESRIMPVSGGGYIQAYNAQASV